MSERPAEDLRRDADALLRGTPEDPKAPRVSVLPVGGSLDRTITDEKGSPPLTLGTLRADPESEWQGDNLWPDEPHPPAGKRLTPAEMAAWGEAKLAFWRTMMRPPYASQRRRKRKPLLTSDFMRSPRVKGAPLVCERCHQRFYRQSRGPLPRYCPACRELSRNAN